MVTFDYLPEFERRAKVLAKRLQICRNRTPRLVMTEENRAIDVYCIT